MFRANPSFWRKVLWLDETKIEDIMTVYQLSGMVVEASCTVAVVWPVVLIHCTHWME